MPEISLFTKQHISVARTLESQGHYAVRQEHIIKANQDPSGVFLTVYNWLAQNAAALLPRPQGAQYPVWASYTRSAAMPPDKSTVLLELRVDSSLVLPIDINKWSMILNYFYIPLNKADARRHDALLMARRTSDAQAFMSPHFPDIRAEIMGSWPRLFDDSIVINNTDKYAMLWQLHSQWLVDITYG